MHSASRYLPSFPLWNLNISWPNLIPTTYYLPILSKLYLTSPNLVLPMATTNYLPSTTYYLQCTTYNTNDRAAHVPKFMIYLLGVYLSVFSECIHQLDWNKKAILRLLVCHYRLRYAEMKVFKCRYSTTHCCCELADWTFNRQINSQSSRAGNSEFGPD